VKKKLPRKVKKEIKKAFGNFYYIWKRPIIVRKKDSYGRYCFAAKQHIGNKFDPTDTDVDYFIT
jgi:hypothetical protein